MKFTILVQIYSYLLVDDWGWAKVGYHCNPPIPEVVSPNFDILLKQGLELDQYYLAIPVLFTILFIILDWEAANPCQ